MCSPAPKDHGQGSNVNGPSQKVQGSKQGRRPPEGLIIKQELALSNSIMRTKRQTRRHPMTCQNTIKQVITGHECSDR